MDSPRFIEEAEATGPVKAAFTEIKALLQVPFVPKVFQALATDPPRLVATWDRLKTLMTAGTLDIMMKEAVALAVALAAENPYFISAHTAALKRLGVTAGELEELREVVELNLGLAAYVNDLGLAPDLTP